MKRMPTSDTSSADCVPCYRKNPQPDRNIASLETIGSDFAPDRQGKGERQKVALLKSNAAKPGKQDSKIAVENAAKPGKQPIPIT
jgi:hypothetical protein